MIIGNFIHSMYNFSEKIEMGFVLTHEKDFIAKGRAFVYRGKEIVVLRCHTGDINITKFKNKNNNKTTININNVPLYFSCELNDFPVENRKNDIVNKNIIIDLPKVKINSSFSFDMASGYSRFECEITPLVEKEDGVLCNLYLL